MLKLSKYSKVCAAVLSLVLAVIFCPFSRADTAPLTDTLLVTVNGQEIFLNDDTLQYYYRSALDTLNADDEDAKKTARIYAMHNKMQIVIVSQKAYEYYTIAEYNAFRAEAKAEWDEIVEEYMADLGITEDSSEEERIAARGDVLSMLESTYGYNEERYVSEGVENLIVNSYYDVIAEDVKAANPSLVATEEEIQQRYNQDVAKEIETIGNDVFTYEMYQMYGYDLHYVPEGYRGITHILLEVDQDLLDNWVDLSKRYENSTEAEAGGVLVTAEMVENARLAIITSQQEKIDEIMKKLDEGAIFEDLIADYGIDPGMEDEYNLANGYPVHKDSVSYVEQFTDGCAALEKVGDVSEPIVTPYGIHILHYLRDIPAGAMEMTDEIREELREEVEYDRVNDAVFAQIDKWKEEADIVWTEEGKEWTRLSTEQDNNLSEMRFVDIPEKGISIQIPVDYISVERSDEVLDSRINERGMTKSDFDADFENGIYMHAFSPDFSCDINVVVLDSKIPDFSEYSDDYILGLSEPFVASFAAKGAQCKGVDVKRENNSVFLRMWWSWSGESVLNQNTVQYLTVIDSQTIILTLTVYERDITDAEKELINRIAFDSLLTKNASGNNILTDGTNSMTLQQPTGKTKYSVNLRIASSSQADIIMRVPSDTIVVILETTTNDKGEIWYQVQVDDKTGYINSDFIELD